MLLDAALVLALPVAGAATLMQPGAPRYVAGAARTVVDGLIVAASVLVVAHELGLDPSARPLALAHALGAVALAAMVVVMATRARAEGRPALILMGAGFTALAAGDFYGVASGFAPVLVLPLAGGVAAISGAIWLARHSHVAEAPGLPTRASVFVPSVPFALALAAVAAEAANGDGFDPFVAWSALAVALLIVARQVLALVENISFWRDLEAKVRARTDDLRRSEARFRSLVQNSSDVITAVDADGRISYQSPSVERVFGFSAADLEGAGLDALVHQDDVPRLLAALGEIYHEEGATLTVECRVRHRRDEFREAEVVTCNLLHDPDVGAFVLNIRDITERKQLERQLTHLAFHDPLTDLANRALFNNRLDHALAHARRSGQPVATLFLDLDDFKNVNDTLGHGSGDELLVGVGRRLSECLRTTDTVARPGGDEFAVLLSDQEDCVAPARVAERILAAFRAPFELEGQLLFVRASVGIAVSAAGTETAEELLRNADIAMYTAKSHGKGMYELYEAGMHEAVADRLRLEVELRGALDRDELHLVYQPIVALPTGQIRGVEALLRWDHPERGPVSPADFVPVAEKTGTIVALGAWVLESACLQTREWQERFPSDPPLSLSINLSARQLSEPHIADVVEGVLANTGLSPESLVLEITESALIDDLDAAIETLSELRDLGCRLAIDDFGTGYSSLGYLRRFPVNLLKIDRSFLAGIEPGSQESALVRAIVAMGRTLGLSTVAEGIETAEQLEELRAMGCELGQGYLFERPLPPAEIEAVLRPGAPVPSR